MVPLVLVTLSCPAYLPPPGPCTEQPNVPRTAAPLYGRVTYTLCAAPAVLSCLVSRDSLVVLTGVGVQGRPASGTDWPLSWAWLPRPEQPRRETSHRSFPGWSSSSPRLLGRYTSRQIRWLPTSRAASGHLPAARVAEGSRRWGRSSTGAGLTTLAGGEGGCRASGCTGQSKG